MNAVPGLLGVLAVHKHVWCHLPCDGHTGVTRDPGASPWPLPHFLLLIPPQTRRWTRSGGEVLATDSSRSQHSTTPRPQPQGWSRPVLCCCPHFVIGVVISRTHDTTCNGEMLAWVGGAGARGQSDLRSPSCGSRDDSSLSEASFSRKPGTRSR